MNDKVFAKQLSNVMTDNKFDRVIGGRKKGKLHMTSLWKAKTGQKNVFKEKQERKGKQYNIGLLLDLSGSMYNYDFIELAAKTVAFLEQQFTDLNVQTSIITFNALVDLRKPLSTEVMASHELQDLASEVSTAGCMTQYACTHTYEALEKAYEQMRTATGQKIVVMITDGLPNCDSPSHCPYDQKKHEAQKIKNLVKTNNNVLTLGLGIQTDFITKLFENHMQIDEISDLKPKLIQFFKEHIRRG